MSHRKEPSIPDSVLDQLLAGSDTSAAFEQGGILAPKSITLNRLGFPSGRFSDSSYWLGLEASMDEALFE